MSVRNIRDRDRMHGWQLNPRNRRSIDHSKNMFSTKYGHSDLAAPRSLLCSDCRRICGQELVSREPRKPASYKSDSQAWQVPLNFHFSLFLVCLPATKTVKWACSQVGSSWDWFNAQSMDFLRVVDSSSRVYLVFIAWRRLANNWGAFWTYGPFHDYQFQI